MLRQLAAWAAMYDCAVVLIGHLNKKQSSKDLYRGLGSIDLVAAARSVLHIERLPEDEDIAVIHHVKSSLTQKSKDVYFTLDANHRVEWLEQPFEVPARQVYKTDDRNEYSQNAIGKRPAQGDGYP